jgi:restriction system protein
VAVPDFQTLMLPLMQAISDGNEHGMGDLIEILAKKFNLTDLDRRELLPSGGQRKFDNRVGWARTYLKKAGLLETPGTARVKITQRGREVLRDNPTRIDVKLLMKYPEFKEFQTHQKESSSQSIPGVLEVAPLESIESGYTRLRSALADELLERVKKCSSKFFEELVVELLFTMGYGGSREDARAVGRSHDGGVDGVIKQDKLGLDSVYIQAKKWNSPVGQPVVAQFNGNLDRHKASKGVIITTSDFTPEAKEFIERVGKKIILVNGSTLVGLMIDNNIGVVTQATYNVKKIDGDYFSEN